MGNEHRFPYCWKRTDLERVKKHGHSVFSTFACGGGSSFGYKMAGFDVLGCNEIDNEMMELYRENHHPKLSYLEPIQDFKSRTDLTEELFNLDILDGSPPCSQFSMAGDREDNWGKEKKFREGQAEQVLSDLFFDYLDVVAKLRPKVSIAENVHGMLVGKAKGYCKLICDRFSDLGYDVQLFMLNSATMGIPQRRKRVFFVARRRDLGWNDLKIDLREDPISFQQMTEKMPFQDLTGVDSTDLMRAFFHKTIPGKSLMEAAGGKLFTWKRLSLHEPSLTLTGSSFLLHPTEIRNLSWIEACMIQSYPYDYNFMGRDRKMKIYCMGMSVPPVMTANIAAKIAEQWFGVSKEQIDEAWSQKNV